jgi:hypothetical protein
MAGLTDGPWEIRITVKDKAGWITSRSVNIIVDTIAPIISTLTFAGLINNLYSPTSVLELNWVIEDSYFDYVEVVLDGLPVFSGTDTPIYLGPLMEGLHTLNFTAFDRAGNMACIENILDSKA